jgi:protein-S-isoprenylcysteine O-methyltransferase Ste14
MNRRSVALKLARLLVRRFTDGPTLLPPPTGRGRRMFASMVELGFRTSIALSVLLLFGAAAVQSSAHWFNWTKVVCGAALLVEGALLASDRWQARQLLVSRLARRSNGGTSMRSRLVWLAVPSGLSLLGLAWMAAGLATGTLAIGRLT